MDFKLCFYVVVLWCFFQKSETARILAIVPTPSFSHQIVYRPIWRELSLRGHHITLLTTDPIKDPTLTNITEIDLHGAYKYWTTNEVTTNDNNPIKQTVLLINMMIEIITYELNHPEVQAIIKNKSEHFDLVMTEYLVPSMEAFSERFNCPFIGLTSLEAPSYLHNYMGNPTHPVLYPEFQLPFSAPLSFFERIASVIVSNGIEVFGTIYVTPKVNKIVEKHFPENKHTFSEVSKNVSMLFINTNSVLQNVRPLGPNTVQFGAGVHLSQPKELPKDLKLYLDGAKTGAIYFSLGTNAKSDSVTPELRRVIIETFKKLPFKILWKFDIDLPDLPSNVKIMKWGPQQDILRHPSVKLFITQGGLQSIEEAVFMLVPMVVVPFFGDQFGNAKIIEKKGLGIALDKNTVTVKSFTSVINEVITNLKYKAAIDKLAELVVDQPMTGIEKVVWWTEYVIRHKGAHHLRNSSVDIPFYQYICLDIIAFVVAILSIPIYLIYKLCKFLIRKSFANKRTEKVKTN